MHWCYHYSLDPQAAKNLYYFPLTRLDSLGIGGLTAVLLLRGTRHLDLWLAGALVVVLALMQMDPVLFKTLLFSAIALATAAVIALFEIRLKHLSTTGPFSRGLPGFLLRSFADIGFFSYFNYLFQFFVIEPLVRGSRAVLHGLPPFWIMGLVVLVVTQALAMLSYRIFEAPLMRWGRTLEPVKLAALKV